VEIVLRPLREEDAPAIVECCNDEMTQRFAISVPSPYGIEDALDFVRGAREWELAGTKVVRAIADPETDEWLGTVDVRLGERPSIGYMVSPRARGRGIATRALAEHARWAIRHFGIERLELTTDPANVASQRVAEKAGFVREGVLRDYLTSRRDGRRRDSVVFSLLPSDLGG
jgi:RimJ/RimL family protein N-acetyltransferase